MHKLFINKNNLEIGEQKRIFNILRDSSKLFAMPHRRESGSFFLGDAKMLIGVVVDNQNKYISTPENEELLHYNKLIK